ncbi:MAG: SpoIIE family protein phosphatase [Parasporobacterium sp.]|nr:SpoIIE family protein phosphatase [Parasporobacterium sp.]
MKKIFSGLKKKLNRITVKSLVGTVALLVLFTAIVSIAGYRSFTNALMQQYAEDAFKTADVAAAMVDADDIPAYLFSGNTDLEYRLTRQQLRQVCDNSGAFFLYVICPDVTDYWHITFVYSTVSSQSGYTEFEFGYVRETTNEDYRTKYQMLYEGQSGQELVVRDRGYIPSDKHITAMVPLKGSDGATRAILCVQYQMSELDSVRMGFIYKVLLILIIVLILVILIQVFYLHRLLLKPIHTITQEASRFAAENEKAGEPLTHSIRNQDEIGILAGSVDRMEEQVEQYIENLTIATAEKERIQTELNLATSIQSSMLPDQFPAFPGREEFDLYAAMDPAREVGGDFYDYFLIDEDHLCMLIADVSGKGIPAALFMMGSMIILKNMAGTGKSPAQILFDANHAICENNKNDMFVSVWLGILEISTGTLTAANAGHEYPAVCHAGGSFEIFRDKHGLVLGAMPGVKFKDYEITLAPGSRIFVYTDGVPEATDNEKSMFGLDRLIEALNQQLNASPEQILTHVRSAVDRFVKEAEQFDDLTMLCLEYKGKTKV